MLLCASTTFPSFCVYKFLSGAFAASVKASHSSFIHVRFCTAVCLWVTLKHTVGLSLALCLCSVCADWTSAGRDASRILISSHLHRDNGMSWGAISLPFFPLFSLLWTSFSFFLSSSLLLCLCQEAPSLLLYCVYWKMGHKGWRGSHFDSRLNWMLLDFIWAGDNTAPLIMNSTHTHTLTSRLILLLNIPLKTQPDLCSAICR